MNEMQNTQNRINERNVKKAVSAPSVRSPAVHAKENKQINKEHGISAAANAAPAGSDFTESAHPGAFDRNRHNGTASADALSSAKPQTAHFQVNFCEFNRSNEPQTRIYRPHGSGDYLFLLLKTPMRFHLNGTQFISRPNACILYAPDTSQDYQAIDRFANSYLHFSCTENLAVRFDVPADTVFYPRNYEEIDGILRKLQEEYVMHAPFSQERAYHLTCEMMITASRGLPAAQQTDADSSLFRSFSALRFEMLRRCELDWTTELLCSQVNLGKSQFFAVYQQFFHSTPHADLLQVRMELAKSLLTNQALPVSQVAAQCGFAELAHFSRCFKKYCGCAPKYYAAQQAGGETKHKA